MSSYRDYRVFFYLCLCVLIDSCILQPARASLLCPYQFMMLCEHGATGSCCTASRFVRDPGYEYRIRSATLGVCALGRDVST